MLCSSLSCVSCLGDMCLLLMIIFVGDVIMQDRRIGRVRTMSGECLILSCWLLSGGFGSGRAPLGPDPMSQFVVALLRIADIMS